MTDEMKTKMNGLAKLANINGAIEESTFIMGFIEAVELMETREKIFWKVIRELRLITNDDYRARELIGILNDE